ncbi:MAG: Na/Pi cotransporter family protein [Firmicutes bacterium]|nr:Na/Pi cotransporter family protein [Bacillota bacterium]MDY5531408.1 Na/Pi cotransporter family protein [Pumilibacteraceae bacterium]
MTAEEIIMFLVKLLAGTGVFLVGVHVMTGNIEQLATGKIKKLFGKTADKKIINAGIGAATTAIVQSSGVTTVLIVGFVNVGVMSLSQATAMIMGANIGTTITGLLAAMSSFSFTVYIQALAFVGVFVSMLTKNDNVKKISLLVSGLALVFIGLSLMSASMKDYQQALQEVFSGISNSFLLFFMGVFLTALVQSSSATTSIIIAMSVAGLQIGSGRNEVLFFILGTNVGSCVTALMSSIGASTNAKRTSLIHLMFNTFGSVLFFIMLSLFPSFMDVTFKQWFAGNTSVQIAMFHVFFNVVCAIIFLPMTSLFVKISQLVIRDKKKEKTVSYLDERMISSPSIATSLAEKELFIVADVAMKAFLDSYKAFEKRDTSASSKILAEVEKTTDLSQNLIDYMIKISGYCSQKEEEKIAALHNCVGDVVRIADIADNFTKYTRREVEKDMEFSDGVIDEVSDMVKNIDSLYALTKQAVLESDKNILPEVDRVEEKIDAYRKSLIDGHIERLNKGLCKPESSSIFINLVSNIERLGDHLTYIAHSVEIG